MNGSTVSGGQDKHGLAVIAPVCWQGWRTGDGSVSVETKGCLSSVRGAGERTFSSQPSSSCTISTLTSSPVSAAAARRRDLRFADGKRRFSSHLAYTID